MPRRRGIDHRFGDSIEVVIARRICGRVQGLQAYALTNPPLPLQFLALCCEPRPLAIRCFTTFGLTHFAKSISDNRHPTLERVNDGLHLVLAGRYTRTPPLPSK